MLKNFERMIIMALIAMMVLVIFISTIELGILIVRDILEPPKYWLGIAALIFTIALAYSLIKRCRQGAVLISGLSGKSECSYKRD